MRLLLTPLFYHKTHNLIIHTNISKRCIVMKSSRISLVKILGYNRTVCISGIVKYYICIRGINRSIKTAAVLKSYILTATKTIHLKFFGILAHVVNIASTAGKEVYENGNVYCSTKHAVDAISKAMRIDLLAEGIKGTSINPGMVETEFSIVRFDGDKEKAKIPYKGIKPLSGEDIAEIIWFALNRPDNVNINDIIITPKAQANSFTVHRKNL